MKTIDKVIKYLDKLRRENPDMEIIIETVDGCTSCKIRDANIYEGMDESLVFDAE